MSSCFNRCRNVGSQKLKIPEKPKRPLTPYLRYLTENRETVQKGNPNFKPTGSSNRQLYST